ncbi:hypothetical protein LCGC14_1102700 [marine sediment metagenome]|uniref:Uncharacterized protein n=1 Tax=marine sediment metagenome TaxID=412755 RepID=A0A0F9M8Z9_9ZZZZ
MTLGTQIRFVDGREATVVFNSLIGVGIVWGLHNPNPLGFEGTDGNTTEIGCPEDFVWRPKALLRDPWLGCERSGFAAEQCVGENYEITRVGFGGEGGEA